MATYDENLAMLVQQLRSEAGVLRVLRGERTADILNAAANVIERRCAPPDQRPAEGAAPILTGPAAIAKQIEDGHPGPEWYPGNKGP